MMSIMRFNDGVTFNTDGELRVERRSDGYYLVGKGMLCPVDTPEEGREMKRRLDADAATRAEKADIPGDDSSGR
jgi:hypothetical protein